MTTKRQIIEQAYSAAGLASYAYDLTAEELQGAMRSLDGMMLQWGIRGVRLGYNTAFDLDAESGLPDWAIEAAALNLAGRLAGGLGKVVTPDTKQAAVQAYNAVVAATVNVGPKLKNTRPRGQGAKTVFALGDPFISTDSAGLKVGGDGGLDL